MQKSGCCRALRRGGNDLNNGGIDYFGHRVKTEQSAPNATASRQRREPCAIQDTNRYPHCKPVVTQPHPFSDIDAVLSYNKRSDIRMYDVLKSKCLFGKPLKYGEALAFSLRTRSCFWCSQHLVPVLQKDDHLTQLLSLYLNFIANSFPQRLNNNQFNVSYRIAFTAI